MNAGMHPGDDMCLACGTACCLECQGLISRCWMRHWKGQNGCYYDCTCVGAMQMHACTTERYDRISDFDMPRQQLWRMHECVAGDCTISAVVWTAVMYVVLLPF